MKERTQTSASFLLHFCRSLIFFSPILLLLWKKASHLSPTSTVLSNTSSPQLHITISREALHNPCAQDRPQATKDHQSIQWWDLRIETFQGPQVMAVCVTAENHRVHRLSRIYLMFSLPEWSHWSPREYTALRILAGAALPAVTRLCPTRTRVPPGAASKTPKTRWLMEREQEHVVHRWLRFQKSVPDYWWL